MKKVLFTLILATIIIGCASTQKKQDLSSSTIASATSNDTIRIANDSLEYEIIIIEPGFNSWLATQPPRGFYGKPFLEIRNKISVTNYNNRASQPTLFDPNIYLQQINYENSIDYGYEVNYLLFNWFEFFQQRYNQKLR